MRRLAPSERMEQELFEAVSTSGDPLGEASRRGDGPARGTAAEGELGAL